jgi:hypothetical protein
MMKDACFCCEALPPAGELFRSVEVRRGSLKGVYRLCEACHLSVSKIVKSWIASGHTFEVLQNAIVNVWKEVLRRKYYAMETPSKKPCQIDAFGP